MNLVLGENESRDKFPAVIPIPFFFLPRRPPPILLYRNFVLEKKGRPERFSKEIFLGDCRRKMHSPVTGIFHLESRASSLTRTLF